MDPAATHGAKAALKDWRRAFVAACARVRRSMPFGVQDALFHLPVEATADTAALARACGWPLVDLGANDPSPPSVIDGSEPDAVAAVRDACTVRSAGGRLFAAAVPDGRVLARACTAIAPNGIVLADASPHALVPLAQHRGLSGALVARPPRRLRGTSALVGAVGHANFYHWMLDMLPRIGLLAEAARADPAFARVDRWIVPATRLEVSRELLALAGVPSDRVESIRRGDQVVCDQLLVTSAPAPICEPTRRSADFLRSVFGAQETAARDGARRIYLARRGRRKIANEAELSPILARFGFETVAMEGLDLASQVEAVRGSGLVVAPHGAALAHLVHVTKGGTLIECLPPRISNPSFFMLAGACGLRYAAIRGCEDRTSRGQPVGAADFVVDPADLERILRVAISAGASASASA
jgi:hypothetical protein